MNKVVRLDLCISAFAVIAVAIWTRDACLTVLVFILLGLLDCGYVHWRRR